MKKTCFAHLFILVVIINFSLVLNEFSITSLMLATTLNRLSDILLNIKDNLSESCFNDVYNKLNQNNQSYILKFWKDSTKNKNDLGSFFDCYNIHYDDGSYKHDSNILNNLIYLMIQVDSENKSKYSMTDTRYEAGNYLFGACFPNSCNEDEYKYIFFAYNDDIKDLQLKDVNVYPFPKDLDCYKDWKTYINLIPVYFILIFCLFSGFTVIPVFLFSCCFKKRLYKNRKIAESSVNGIDDITTDDIFQRRLTEYKEMTESKLSQNMVTNNCFGFDNNIKRIPDPITVSKFKDCFNIEENSEQLTNDNDRKLNNDDGLTLVRGLRGISMILLTTGFVFRELIASPVKNFCFVLFKGLLSNYAFGIQLLGLRIAPNLCYSISSYILTFKLINYLDDQIERDESRRNSILGIDPCISTRCDPTVDIKPKCNEKNCDNKQSIISSKYLILIIRKR